MMNVKIMLMRAAGQHMPGFIKKNKLEQLFRLTADAFQAETPESVSRSFSEYLRSYAVFSGEQAEQCLHGQGRCTPEETKSRLRENSYQLGRHLRRRFHIINREEAMEALSMIYRMMGIDFQADADQDEFVISRCYFSSFYTPSVCRLMSSMDKGLAEGLTGGRLRFTQRITNGSSCCRGCISKAEEKTNK